MLPPFFFFKNQVFSMNLSKIFGAVTVFLFLTGAGAWAQTASTSAMATTKQTMQVQQIRNATAKITYGDTTFLLDPLLAKKGAYPGFPGTFHLELRNPMIDLPMSVKKVMADVDAVIITHTHLDHWDGGNNDFIPKSLPLFVQDESDAKLVRGQGFTDVRILGEDTVFEGVRLSKTGGQHGTAEMYADPAMGKALGEAMGVIFRVPGAKTLYVVGDTVWNKDVDQTLAKFKPDVMILNAGDARMPGYLGSIIMGKDDVLHAYKAAPNATIIASHMDAINHMTLTRKELKEHVQQHGIQDRIRIPADGDTLSF